MQNLHLSNKSTKKKNETEIKSYYIIGIRIYAIENRIYGFCYELLFLFNSDM